MPEIDLNVLADTAASLDDILILADGHERETTFTPATNNELASSTDYNGTTTYAYDNWSRLSTETRGGVTKTYSWTMANLLAGVDSSDANDTDVSYLYTGDLKRLFRFENGNLKNSYGWDAGFNVVDETEWSGGSPVADKAYAGGLAEVDTTGTPDYAYLTHDHLGSTRGLWDGSIDQTGSWEFTPYGAQFAFAGPADVTQLYTGHDLEPVTGQYYAPFRFLDPKGGRWLKQDPLGMAFGTNMFGYVAGNPLNLSDPLGLGWGDVFQSLFCMNSFEDDHVDDSLHIPDGPPYDVDDLVNVFGTVVSMGPGGELVPILGGLLLFAEAYPDVWAWNSRNEQGLEGNFGPEFRDAFDSGNIPPWVWGGSPVNSPATPSIPPPMGPVPIPY